MPVAAQQISSAILGAATFPGGPTWPALAQAVGQGVFTWAVGQPQNLLLTGVTSGGAGAGIVSGSLVIPPNPAPVIAAMAAAGAGVTAPQIGTAVAIGVSAAFTSSALYTGPSVGVSSGTDQSSVVVSNPVTLVASLLAAMSTTFASLGGGGGPTTLQTATGLGNGIANLFLQGTGTGIVTPTSPLPGPAAGTSPLSIVL